VITDRYLQSHHLCYALNNRGRLFICRPSTVDLVLPDFAPLDKVQRINEILGTTSEPAPTRPERIPPTPEGNEQEFNVLLNSLTLSLHHVKTETDTAMRYVRQTYKSVYQLLKHKDPVRTTSVFTPDIAQMLFNTDDPTYAELYATHKLLADDRTHFVPDPTRHVETATFLVRAYRDVLLVTRVGNWVRESSKELEAFLDKSRKLISLSRSLPNVRTPTKLDVPVPSELYFNGNDRYIIEFIVGYVTGRRGFIPTDLLALTPLIMNRTGMYPSDVIPNPDRNAAKLFLTEIGVWQPSESIPSHTDAGVSMQRLYEEQPVTESFGDANSGARHDFGEMPVYTIDDASAHELDDGISIEETDQGTWLHIHIANPSAFIPPQSQIASLARLRQTTLYLPDKVRPMLPIEDENFSAKGFSKDSQLMSTMTFSARLSSDGNIEDYKVRPGLVRNVNVLTYDDVDTAVFPKVKRNSYSWWTSNYIKPDYNAMGKRFDTVTPNIQSHLSAIENIIQKHRDWRTNNGALRMTYHTGSIQVNPKPLEWEATNAEQSSKTDHAPLRKTVPTFIRGTAGFLLSIGDQKSQSRSLIEEMMIIAGRVAGLFAKQHNLPVVYRGLTTNIPQSLLEECRSLQISGTKILPLTLSRKVLATSGSWFVQQSPSPQSHELLGISAEDGGYVQVTSPMRRYLDILAHWQFEAHLRGSRLPFTLAELMGTGETSILQASRRLHRRTFLSRKFTQFYAAHAVSQLVSNPFEVGSTHLEFVNGNPRLTGFLIDQEIKGTTYLLPRFIGVKELGVTGMLLLRHDDKLLGFDKEFPVEIQEVNEAEGTIVFSLVRGS
jgi:exoribonuclease II